MGEGRLAGARDEGAREAREGGMAPFVETRDVWELAKLLGMDIEEERVRFLLTQPEITMREACELLARSPQAMHDAFSNSGNLKPFVRWQRMGKRNMGFVHPVHLL